jgi:hypothetical protein
MKIALRLLILSLAMQVTSYATSYYFSQSTGSDSNGCTAASPCQTLAKANNLTLSAGDSILLMCGDTWMETLTPQQSNVNYDHWGPCNTTAGGNLPPVVMGSTAVCGYVTPIPSRCTMDINGRTNITVKHIDFNGSNQGGVGGQVYVHGASSAILFDYLKIHFAYENVGIACATTNNVPNTLTVANSQISANSFEAVYVRGAGASGFCNIDLVNNIIVANTVRYDHDLAYPPTYGLICYAGSTCTLQNNLIGGNGRLIELEINSNWYYLGGNLLDSYIPSVVNTGFNEWYFMGTNDGDSAHTGSDPGGMLAYAAALYDAFGSAAKLTYQVVVGRTIYTTRWQTWPQSVANFHYGVDNYSVDITDHTFSHGSMISVNGLAFNPGSNTGAYYNNNVATGTLTFGDANGHTFTVIWSAPSNRKFFWDARKQVCGSSLAYNAGGTASGVWNTCTGASGWTIGAAAINGFGLDDLTDIRSLPDSGGTVPIPSNTWTLTPLDTAAYYHIELDETKSLIENPGTDMWGNQQLGLGQVKRVCFGAGTTNTVASAAAQAAGFYSMLTGSSSGATDLTHFYNYFGTEGPAVGELLYYGSDEASVRAAARFFAMSVPMSGSIFGLYWHTSPTFQQQLIWAEDEFHKWTGRYFDTYNGAYSALETTHTCSGIVPNAYCDPIVPVVDNSDFHPLPGGVQIGAGLNLGAGYDVDMDGNSQPASGPWTMGPYAVFSGGSPGVSVTPASLDFGVQGTSSPITPQVITLTSSGVTSLTITGIGITGANSGDFVQWNNCPLSPNSLGPGAFCMITVMFAPTETGTLNANVSITDNAPDSPQLVPMTGTAVGGRVALR